MKAKFFLSAVLMTCCMFAFSQSSYYYYRGNKIPLNEDSRRLTIITPKERSAKILESVNVIMKHTKSIEDKDYDISVIDLNDTIALNRDCRNTISSLKGSSGVIILPCYMSQNGEKIVMTNYLNVKLKSIGSIGDLISIAEKYNLEIVEENEFMPLWYTMRITGKTTGSTLDVANRIYESGLVSSAVADFISEDDVLCTYDPSFNQQWGLYNSSYPNADISICAAWSLATGRGITIAVLDNGIDLGHSDLMANIYSLSYDTESGTSPSRLYGNHGTHCAGIAAAVRNNGLHVAGVAPDAKLMSISNTLSGWGANSLMKRANGINWAWKHGADIISNSWKASTKNEAIEDAINSALTNGRNRRGCIIVFASGNDNGSVSYPANCRPEIIAVGAIDNTGKRASYSNYGRTLDVVAPGTRILSTIPGNSTAFMSGTSMACPHVAGIAALILERNPGLTHKQVVDIIEKSSKKIGDVGYNTSKVNGSWNDKYGYGLVNAYNAVRNTPLLRSGVASDETVSSLNTEQDLVKIESISPNPASHKVVVKYTLTNAVKPQIMINSLSGFSVGKKVYDLSTEKDEIAIDLSEYPQGLYVVSLVSDGKSVSSVKFIKE